MADFLVLREWSGSLTPGSGVARIAQGSIISDDTLDVVGLIASGLRAIPVNAPLAVLLLQGDRDLGDVVAAAVQQLYNAGGGDDDQVKVSLDDTTPAFLSAKVVGNGGVTVAVLNPGANEQLEISSGAAPPTGPAAGDLSGTYPDPDVATVGGTAAATIGAHPGRTDNPHAVTHAQTGVTANQHHNEDHAARHSDGGADEVTVENLATSNTDSLNALRPNGSGGVEFASAMEIGLHSESLGTDTTSGSTPITKTSLVIPAEDGTWEILGYGSLSHSNSTGNPNMWLENTTDAVELGTRPRFVFEPEDASNDIYTPAIYRRFTNTVVAGAKTIALRYAVDPTSGTMSISDAHLTARKVA